MSAQIYGLRFAALEAYDQMFEISDVVTKESLLVSRYSWAGVEVEEIEQEHVDRVDELPIRVRSRFLHKNDWRLDLLGMGAFRPFTMEPSWICGRIIVRGEKYVLPSIAKIVQYGKIIQS